MSKKKVMNKRISIITLVIVAMLLMPFYAVHSKSDDANPVIVWGSELTRENDALREIAETFTKETGIPVEIVDRRSLFDAKRDLVNNAETKSRPDIVMIQNADIGELAVNGFLLELDFGDYILNSFHETAFSAFNVYGKQYGIGYSAETYGLIYNKDVIAPQMIEGMTWDEFFDFAIDFGTIDHDGTRMKAFMLNPKNMYFTYPIIKNYGGYYYGKTEDGEYNAYDVGLNNEGMVEYVGSIKRLFDNGLVFSGRNGTDNDVSAAFANNQTAMIINGFWQNSFYTQKGVDFGLMPLPKNNDGTQSEPFATVNGFVVNAHSTHKDNAVSFLEYMCKDENQQKLIEAGNNYDKKTGCRFPVNLSVRSSEYIQNDPLYSMMCTVCYSIEPIPNIPEGDIWYTYTDKAFQNIFYGDINGNPIDAKAMLDELASSILSDVKKMNVIPEQVEIPVIGYVFVGVAAFILILLLVLRIIKRKKDGSLKISKITAKTTTIAYIVLAPVLVLIGIFYLFPIVHNIYLSMTNYSSLNLVDYVFVGGHNYKTIFTEGLNGFASMFIWTVVFAVSVMVITFLAGTVLASMLEKRNVTVSRIYKMIFILPWVIPSVIMLLTWKGILATDGGMINLLLQKIGISAIPFLDNPLYAKISSILVVSWIGTPYYMFLALGYLQSIPKDYYEAAYVEGAGRIRVFFSITVPLLIKALFPTLIMGFIMQFNNFGLYLLTNGGPFGTNLNAPGATDLLITYVYNLAYNTKNYGLAAAYSVIIFIFVAVFTIFTMQKGNKKISTGGDA